MQREVIGDCTLYCGDALEVLPTLGQIASIITDPPYAVPTVVAQGCHNTRNVGDLSIVETAMRVYVKAMLERLYMRSGRVFIFCDGTSYPVMFRVLYSHLQTALLIWNKRQIGLGREFRKSHELILHGWEEDTPIYSDGVGRADILDYAPVRPEKRIHPAEKPIGLLTELARVCESPICDPFMGSGNAGVAALLSRKSFIGCEIEPRYFDGACQRITDAYTQLDLFVPPPPAPRQEVLF